MERIDSRGNENMMVVRILLSIYATVRAREKIKRGIVRSAYECTGAYQDREKLVRPSSERGTRRRRRVGSAV